MMRRNRTVKLWGASLAIASAAAVIALFVGGAQAQSTSKPTEVLVSNTGIPADATGAALWSQDLAQDFTAGSNAAGYFLTQIELSLTTIGANIDAPTVTLVSGSPDATDGISLNGPASLVADMTQLYAFTAPSGTTLSSSTQYWVVVEHSEPRGTDVRLDATDSMDYRATDEPIADVGWSIGDYIWYSGVTGGLVWGGEIEPGQPSEVTREDPGAFLLSVTGTAIGGV